MMNSDFSSPPGHEAEFQAVLDLAKTCEYEAVHSHQVTNLALRLFDGLQILHQLGIEERFLLQCAAILHDIGWIEGARGHHKVTMRIILTTTLLPFDNRRRLMMGLTARYHRKSLPVADHEDFASLNDTDQRIVEVLSACLRMANGLDRSHQSHIQELTCQVKNHKVILHVKTADDATEDIATALKNARFFETVFHRKLIIESDEP